MTTPIQALAWLSRQDPAPEYFVRFQEEVNAEKNERGAAILLASNTELALQAAISRNLVIHGDAYDELFKSGAPLRSFEAKLRVGYAMGIFGDETRHNLDCIKAIRNAFAHAVIPISFETKEVKDVCNTMREPETLYPTALNTATMKPIGEGLPDDTPRMIFQKICATTSHNLFWFGTTISRGIPSDQQVGTYVKPVRPKPLP